MARRKLTSEINIRIGYSRRREDLDLKARRAAEMRARLEAERRAKKGGAE